ncbi:hypothetical protein BY458DRAFT_519634 [Sporodiniella umbellata]|nr:hypothetical protein BY458DRAFT_519634 [Sporodiniella umbellata]
MSHFRFPRTSRPIEQELMDTVTHPMEHQQHELEEMGSVHSESSSESTILAPRAPVVIERRCWICFGDSSDSQGRWVKPCGCTLEAHQSCLLDWIAENQKASPTKTVRCPQCSASYHLAQQGSLALALFTLLDSLTRTAAPYVAVLGLGCSVLITCTTFGAYTVMVMLGQREGERLIGNPNFWTWRTWIGLPLIPVLLISTRTRWANLVLPLATASYLRAAYERPHFRWLPTAFTYGIMPWFWYVVGLILIY